MCAPSRGKAKIITETCDIIEKIEAENNKEETTCLKTSLFQCKLSESDLNPNCISSEEAKDASQQSIAPEEPNGSTPSTEEKSPEELTSDKPTDINPTLRYLQENVYTSTQAGVDESNYNVGGSTPDSKATAESQQELVTTEAGKNEAQESVVVTDNKTTSTTDTTNSPAVVNSETNSPADVTSETSSSVVLIKTGLMGIFVILSLLF